jgi:hypothetical protein
MHPKIEADPGIGQEVLAVNLRLIPVSDGLSVTGSDA